MEELPRAQDHLGDGRPERLDRARWRWCREGLAEAEEQIVAELQRLGGSSRS